MNSLAFPFHLRGCRDTFGRFMQWKPGKANYGSMLGLNSDLPYFTFSSNTEVALANEWYCSFLPEW